MAGGLGRGKRLAKKCSALVPTAIVTPFIVYLYGVCVCIDGGFEGVLAGGGEERMRERERESKKEKKGKEKEQTRHGGEND